MERGERGGGKKGLLVKDPVVLGQEFDDVRPVAGQLVVDLGCRGERGLASAGGHAERVHAEDVAQVGVEGLGGGGVSMKD